MGGGESEGKVSNGAEEGGVGGRGFVADRWGAGVAAAAKERDASIVFLNEHRDIIGGCAGVEFISPSSFYFPLSPCLTP